MAGLEEGTESETWRRAITKTPAPRKRKRIIRNAAHFFQREAAATAAALNGANAGNCDDFPEHEAEQLACIDQMLDAIDNTEGVIDNDSSDQKAIRDLPRDKMETMAWRALYKIKDVQMVLHNPDILTVHFPNYMRYSSKAAATQFFAVPLIDRFIANPIMELDTKLSNNNTNAKKVYNSEVKAAESNGRTVTKLDDRAEIRDASGELLKILMKPRKRVLSEFLPPDLAQSPAAKVKRARGSRRGGGASPSPVASFVTPANGGSPAQNIAANALPPIQEEEESVELNNNVATSTGITSNGVPSYTDVTRTFDLNPGPTT
ncbi:hypothetical protein QBC32DRAFT_318880 [Pseudoneurospora amorphoporcata]|uniref:Uncharacterized protein n=1 Tax=Pseudoneurospora amorphoporcata TaxID=241081 RepID=A0AAN6NKA0_9PEZI|nr:hypothetical protein QBC32DRAFT_318880 [Pseudoneurospora amorphoporcata]